MLFNKLAAFYKSINWTMDQVPNENILSTIYGGKNEEWVFVATTDEPNGIVIMFARSPDPCPAEKQTEMLAFFNKANFGMTHGAWVMDQEDGEIRFRLGVDAGKLDISDEYLRDLTLYTNLTMERYIPGIKAIINENKNASQAMEIVFKSN